MGEKLKVIKGAGEGVVVPKRKVEAAQSKLLGYIRASVSVIWVRCAEEVRFERQLIQMAKALDPARIVRYWSITQGVTGPVRGGMTRVAGTGEEQIEPAAKSPLQMLEWAMANARQTSGAQPTIIVARDFHTPLRTDQMTQGPAAGVLTRSVRDAIRTLRSAPNKTTVLILSASSASAIPGDLQAELGYVEWPLPDRDDVSRILDVTIKNVGSSIPVPENGERERLVDASLGLTAEQIANAYAISVVERNRLDGDTVLSAKAEEVRKLGLVYVDPDPTRKIGGYANALKWLRMMKSTLSPKAREYGLEPPKGVFLAGVSGCLAADVTVPDPTTGRETTVFERWQAAQPFVVWSRDFAGRAVPALALPPVRYPKSKLLRFHFDSGESITVTPKHRFFSNGREVFAEHVARLTRAAVPVLLDSTSSVFPSTRPASAPHSARTSGDSRGDCRRDCGCGDAQLRPVAGIAGASLPSQSDVPARTLVNLRVDDPGGAGGRTHPYQSCGHPSMQDFVSLDYSNREDHSGFLSSAEPLSCKAGCTGERVQPSSMISPSRTSVPPSRSVAVSTLFRDTRVVGERSHAKSSHESVSVFPHDGTRAGACVDPSAFGVRLPPAEALDRAGDGLLQFARGSTSALRLSSPAVTVQDRRFCVKVVAVEDAGEAEYYDFHVPLYENYFAGGVWNHNCGKSLLAIIVANEWLLPLVKVDMSAMLGKYVGESEEKTDRILNNLSAMAPCIALFDEVEKVFAGMGGGGDASDGGVKRGVFGKVLTWMNDQSGVFIIATANDVQGLLTNAPEFARKGRFDELFFVDLPNAQERTEIAAIHIARRRRDPLKFNLPAIADASVGLSGAEIEDSIKSALRTSYTDGMRELRTDDVIAAVKATVPLSRTASQTINQLREWAKGRCVSATPPDENVVNENEGDIGARNLDLLPDPGTDPALS